VTDDDDDDDDDGGGGGDDDDHSFVMKAKIYIFFLFTCGLL
jgi:hypothetical protein